MGHTEGQLFTGFLRPLRNRQIKGQAALTEKDHGHLRISNQEDSEKLEDH